MFYFYIDFRQMCISLVRTQCLFSRPCQHWQIFKILKKGKGRVKNVSHFFDIKQNKKITLKKIYFLNTNVLIVKKKFFCGTVSNM